uniref:Chitin-binding type-2 domain-containing protein n=1 Tax=Anopheles dirus TaxID=7168 RepID=A0A182NFA0_9DIPT
MRHYRRAVTSGVTRSVLTVLSTLVLACLLSVRQTAQNETSDRERISCYNASTAPDYLCPPDVARLRLVHETSCQRYYVCENGKATEISCAGRRYFNPRTKSCSRSRRACRTSARVLIGHVAECQTDGGKPGSATCRRTFVPYPSAGNATGVLVCNGDGSAFLAHCPLTCTGLQTVFINGKCRLRQVVRGRHKWEKLLQSPGRYPPDKVAINRTLRTRAGIRPLDTCSERTG